MVRCSVQPNGTGDHVVHLEHRRGEHFTRHQFSVDRSECPAPYCLFLALTDFVEEHDDLVAPLVFHVSDLFVYNVLSSYLQRWQAAHWFNSRGQPVPYVDILSNFYHVMATKRLAYKVILLAAAQP